MHYYRVYGYRLLERRWELYHHDEIPPNREIMKTDMTLEYQDNIAYLTFSAEHAEDPRH